jgi:hypothetical protein
MCHEIAVRRCVVVQWILLALRCYLGSETTLSSPVPTLVGRDWRRGEGSLDSCRLDRKWVKMLLIEPTFPVVIVMVLMISVLENRHAMNQWNTEIITDKTINRSKNINNPNKNQQNVVFLVEFFLLLYVILKLNTIDTQFMRSRKLYKP